MVFRRFAGDSIGATNHGTSAGVSGRPLGLELEQPCGADHRDPGWKRKHRLYHMGVRNEFRISNFSFPVRRHGGHIVSSLGAMVEDHNNNSATFNLAPFAASRASRASSL